VRLVETVEGVPGERSLWVDASGETIADSIEGPFGPMATCRSSRDAALAATAGGSPPAEMYERTIVRSNVRLADPAGVDRLVLRVRPLDAKRPLPDLAAHNQAVRADGDAVRVEIRRPAGPGGAGGAAAAATPAAEYLRPNAIVASDHPEIAALAREIAGEERDPWQVAQRLTRWVAENLTLDLGVVMAPAGELVRDRRATCVGYATLLAALARASGIPSRLAMGAVYYGGIWGGHAWTEVWIDGRWLPLDAAVYAPGLASATRLAAGTSSLQDGGGELTGRLGQMFGNVDIDIVEVETDGREVDVDPAAAAYTITDGTYANPGLGLRVAAPGWEVEDADSTWPSTLVVAFRRGEERVELHELPRAPAGRSLEAVRAMVEQGRAVLAAPAGGTLWLHVASGPRPEASLRELLPMLRMER
jgi:transglutaminase-like putative cysteine protease